MIYLNPLTDNELFALCKRLILLHSAYYRYTPSLNDGEIEQFLRVSLGRIGAEEMVTPREITRDFLNILDILFTNPDTSLAQLLGSNSLSCENKEKEAEENKTDFLDFNEILL